MKINTNISTLLKQTAAAPSSDDQLVEQSRKWVSQTFYGTLLKQLRNSPFKSDILSGGRGAQAFGPLVDQNMVDSLSRATGSKLVNSLVKSMKLKSARRSANAAQGGTNVSTIA